MTIKGTAVSPGFVAPKIGKICGIGQRCREEGGIATYRKDDQEQEVHVRNVMELEPQILGYEAERRVLGRPDLISAILFARVAILIHILRRERDVEVDCSWALIVPIIFLHFLHSFHLWLL